MSSSDREALQIVRQTQDHWVGTFRAMACPCEVHVRTRSSRQVRTLAALAHDEALRIEHKFSRYRDDNIVHEINHANGRTVPIDEETRQLLDYAGSCYQLSAGLFDITSGILRQAWTFDGSEVEPNEQQIEDLLERVGWDKVQVSDEGVRLEPGMEIDLGGVGKEYAVDRIAQLLFDESRLPLMISFGGDIRVPGDHQATEPWRVGIGDPETPEDALGVIELSGGGVTTSGVSYRHCFVDGKRLGHILNPRTGWPVEDAPRSVTVVAGFCLEAGMLSTMAMLQGKNAEAFLDQQEVTSHCIW